MTLSRKAVRPAQTAFLLAHCILSVSLDYHLCSDINIIDGPRTDIRDAYGWVRSSLGLQAALDARCIPVKLDSTKVIIIGRSTGGLLTMTLAWTSKEADLPPPDAILGFCSPTDFESGGKFEISSPYFSCNRHLFVQILMDAVQKSILSERYRWRKLLLHYQPSL